MSAEFPMQETDLCALIGSRICHDLVSPVGAIGNGVELLGMSGSTPGGTDPEYDLVRQSVENAQARLRFFRVAYGQSGGEQEVGRSEVLAILTALFEGQRLKVHWAVEEARSRAELKIAFLLLQCLESAMPYGGQVHISCNRAGWRIAGEAEKMRIEPLLWDALDTGVLPAQLRPSQVQFALVLLALRQAGARLTSAVEASRITLTVT